MDSSLYIRKRVICLTRKGPPQAQEACAALSGVKGIHKAVAVSANRISLVYSLEYLTFELIEALLTELDYELDNHIFAVIRRGIYQYLEDTARGKIQVEEDEHGLVCDVDIDTELPHAKPEKYWNNYR